MVVAVDIVVVVAVDGVVAIVHITIITSKTMVVLVGSLNLHPIIFLLCYPRHPPSPVVHARSATKPITLLECVLREATLPTPPLLYRIQ